MSWFWFLKNPVVDSDILELIKEEKERFRREDSRGKEMTASRHFLAAAEPSW